MERVYILLPTYNRREITLEFITYVKSQAYKNYQLILIDDGSNDNTSEAVKESLPDSIVIQGKGDWWWAGGLQQGINWLKQNEVNPHDIVLIINDDVKIEANFIEAGVKFIQQNPKTLLQAQATGLPSKSRIDIGVKADLENLTFEIAGRAEEVNCLSTMGLFLRFSDLLEIGNFYPRILPHYLSDYEYTIRSYKKGFKLCSDPSLKLSFNEETTGDRHFKQLNFFQFLKSYFSKRSAANPISWSACALLVVPKVRLPIVLFKIWKGAIITCLKRLAVIMYWNTTRILKSE